MPWKNSLVSFVLVLSCWVGFSGAATEATNTPLFLPAQTYGSGGSEPLSVAIADLNGDGKPDLVVVNRCELSGCSRYVGTVGVLLGNGDGKFQPAVIYESGGFWATSVKIADVNGDHIPDLVVANCGPAGTYTCQSEHAIIAILLGKGDGTFHAATTYDAGGYGPSSLAVADVNADGKPDLLVGNNNGDGTSEGNVAVLLGKGDGTFQTATTYDSGAESANSIAVRDVNGDGKPDVLVSNLCIATPEQGCISEGMAGVLLGNGDGTFKPAVIYASGGYTSTSVAVADVNRDGKPDLLVGSVGVVGVLLGNGDGTFQQAVTYDAIGSSNNVSIVVADVNGDGKPDVLATNITSFGSGLVEVLLGNGDGTFQAAVNYDTSGSNPSAIAVADLNRDGLRDVVVTECAITGCGNGSAVGVLLHVGSTLTTTTLSSSLNPSVFGQPITFTTEVRSALGTPSGTVKFFDGSTEFGSAALVNGSASISISTTGAGSHSITAVYQGSLKFKSSASKILTQVVSKASTSISLRSSHNPALVRESVTYTATVFSRFGGALTGSVVFSIDGNAVDSASVLGNRATMTTSFANIGNRTITAQYFGDPNNTDSTPATLKQSVVLGTKMTLASSPNPSFVGQAVKFSATISSGSGTPPDGEIITFSDGAKIYGTAALKAGAASLIISSIPAGTPTIRASYGGDSTFSANFAHVEQIVKRYSTSTVVSTSANPSAFGQPITLTATVTASGSSTPTGWVTFKDGTNTIGVRSLNGGRVNLTVSTLPVGMHSITASYSITPAWAPSVSPVLTQVVQ